MEGFFKATRLNVVKQPRTTLAQCGACGLFKTCRTPKMAPTGNGRRGVLVVGEAPGKNEDQEGRQFVGETGQLLQRVMRSVGLDLRKDCVSTNALICRPPGNEIPDDKMVDYCRPNLLKAVEECDPKVILLLGGNALRSLLEVYYKEDIGGIKRWAGFAIPCRKPNAWIVPTFHPSFVARETRDRGMLLRLFTRHVERAAELANGERPWDEVEDWRKKVIPLYSPEQAARYLCRFVKRAKNVAFDYETTCLKPDGPASRIVCCSVSDGETTIAYPWLGEAIDATRDLLRSPVGKIASNMKFEERWTRRHLRTRVRNWRWDTMQMAHVLDCRPGINSIKFQAFVRLGQEDYDGHLKPFLQSDGKGGYDKNTVEQIDLGDLLLYCGLDSLLEYKVAHLQAKELGVKL